MSRPPARLSIALVALALGATPGCLNNFDPALYMMPDGGGDAGPSLSYVDLCNSITPSVFPPGVSVFAVDTMSSTDDMRAFTSCIGRETPGNDTFIAIDAAPNERWHFHVRQSAGSTVDPALYILTGCDERECQTDRAINACGNGANEHLSFVAPASGGRFIVGVDSIEPGGFMGTLEIYRPICGNSTMAEHSENCDDGNTMSGDGCDSLCRRELTTPPLTEFGVNDDFYSSNHVLVADDAVVLGDVGACDSDVYAVDLTMGTMLRVELAGRGAATCPPGAPEVGLALLAPAGAPALVTAPLGACPVIDFAVPATGTYFVRVRSVGSVPFDYDLKLMVTP